jgi:hypothetical protein
LEPLSRRYCDLDVPTIVREGQFADGSAVWVEFFVVAPEKSIDLKLETVTVVLGACFEVKELAGLVGQHE